MKEISRTGFMLILSSPSGAGKTTLSKELIKASTNLVNSVSVTTRKMRPLEQEGIDYFFININAYNLMLKSNQLIEHAKVFDNYYGTPKDYVFNNLAQGIDVLFDIDWQGTQQMIDKYQDQVVSIYILPPSMQELKKRLISRANDSSEVIQNRMAKADLEISHWHSYNYVIINYDIKESLKQLFAILTAERLKKTRQVGMPNFVDNLIKGNKT
jgi:guanylate kinase